MLNKKQLRFVLVTIIMSVSALFPAISEDFAPEIAFDEGAFAVMEYQVDGSLFQKIADLEQDKVLMQLEKERAQLQLDLERLAAEHRKISMEADAMDTRAEEQRNKLEAERQKLEIERDRLEQQRRNMENQPAQVFAQPMAMPEPIQEQRPSSLAERYRLMNVMGAGRQLQATLEDLATGQRKKVSVGRDLDGYEIRSISLDDGVTFYRDGVTEMLSIGR